MASGIFRFMASLGQDTAVANTLASFALVVTLVLSGFILSHDKIRAWWIWGYWISPLMYAMNALSINEFLGHKWKHYAEGATEYLGIQVLKNRGLPTEAKWYWIGVGALIGFVIIFNFFFTVALSYLKRKC
ncbi:ABC transporter G family member 44 [Carex littledalei]|uniref:ABC transporter G family member 44 n=1 Tax=Carex littledalei TaxID=544730 RepID=A0A833QR19_9POAL|nr:ABC transporter G family member 44 [Carex littledalei]